MSSKYAKLIYCRLIKTKCIFIVSNNTIGLRSIVKHLSARLYRDGFIVNIRRGSSMAGISTPSSSSSAEHISVPMEKDRGTEAVFQLNPTEPHNYQVRRSSMML